MKTTAFEDVLKFWFPSLPDGDLAARVGLFNWWFRGDAEIVARFSPHLECAIRGELEYLATGQLVHKQPFPPDLSQFLIQH